MLGSAYLLAHFVVGRLQKRFLFLSGLEYVALGIFLGPTLVPQVHPFSNLTALGPVFAFAAGWVGLLYGLQLQLTSLERISRPFRLAVGDVIVTGGLITAAAQWFLQSGLVLPPAPPDQAWLSALVLGCAAAAGSSSAVDLLTKRYAHIDSHLLPMLRDAAHISDLLAISIFGVLLAVFHVGDTVHGVSSSPSDWILWTVGLGVALGVLFVLFIGNDEGENNVFLAMVGILLFASGAAFFLHISALTVNLILGVVLAQTRQGAKIRHQLTRTERPVSLILLVFAGALWEPVPLIPAVVLVLGFLGLRLIGKVTGVYIAMVNTPLRGDLFRGLMAQGNAAVAIALSFQLVYDGPTVDLVYTTILAAVAVNELISPRLLRGLLVDSGELRQDLAWSSRQ
ncbi:MAG: cation:proton antiporter [Myxococcales bacterium]|nr:cation:proton antiporter [Myxococcales bacterium]